MSGLPAGQHQVKISGMANTPAKPQGPDQSSVSITRPEKIALFTILILGIIYVLWKVLSPSQVTVELGEDINLQAGIVVQVEGAVVSPGIIALPEGSTVGDAIEAAGGLTGQADRTAIDVTETVSDGERIDIPFLGDSDSTRTGDVYSHDIERVDINEFIGDERYSSSRLVNINDASIFELQVLPGIGESIAEKILAYRIAHNGFDRIEDIMLVDGIGEAKYEAIRNLITVDD